MSRQPTPRELDALLSSVQRPIEVRLGRLLNALGWLFVAALLASWAISRWVSP